jgi:hypothetical protein
MWSILQDLFNKSGRENFCHDLVILVLYQLKMELATVDYFWKKCDQILETSYSQNYQSEQAI